MIRGILSTLLLLSSITTFADLDGRFNGLHFSVDQTGALEDKPKCIRWAWSGDVYNRTVWCLEWTKLKITDKKGST